MRFCFSTDDLLPGDRLQAWCDYLNERAFGYAPGGVPDSREFQARMDGFAAGRFILMDIRANHTAARRTAAHVARETTRAFAICRFNSATCWKAAPRSTPVDIQFAPADWVITSSEWEFDAIGTTRADWDVLVIPNSVLSPLLTGGRLTRPFKLAADSPLGGLLSASLDAAKVQVPLLPPELGDAVLRNLCELVVLACGAAVERPSSGRDALRGGATGNRETACRAAHGRSRPDSGQHGRNCRHLASATICPLRADRNRFRPLRATAAAIKVSGHAIAFSSASDDVRIAGNDRYRAWGCDWAAPAPGVAK